MIEKIKWAGPGWYICESRTEEEIIMSRIADAKAPYAKAMSKAQSRGFIEVNFYESKPGYMKTLEAE